jgi:hypothetical protein
MRFAVLVTLLIACGNKPPAKPAKQCDPREPGKAMTEAQCQCEGGRVALSMGDLRVVEVHEPDEHEIGSAKIGDRQGWCCK